MANHAGAVNELNKEKDLEDEANALALSAEEIDALITGVDISMPDDYSNYVYAQRRVELVTTINLQLLQADANKVLNERVYDEIIGKVKTMKLELGLSDKRHPEAIKISKQVMRKNAENDRRVLAQ